VLKTLPAALCAAALLAIAPGDAAAAGEWLAGDLHVHTTYSHDSYGGPTDDNTGPEDANTAGHNVTADFALAAARGLDYLAITDHNDIRSQSDAGFGFGGVIPVPGYENSLKGHGQMLGATRIYDNGDKSVAAIRSLEEQLHAAPDRGIFQANHPSDPLWEYQYDVPVDTVEAWNLPWVYKPPFPAAADNDIALKYWQGWLDRGKKVGMTGASDSHWLITDQAQGPGQPTTWVFATERSARGVLEGLRAGHTFVSHQPPNYNGPQVFLEGDGDRDGSYESIVGDTVPPGSPLRVRVVGAAGALLRIVTDGGAEAFPPVTIDSADFEHRFTLPAASTWAHAQVFGEDLRPERATGCTNVFGADDVTAPTAYCYGQVLMLAMSSALYLRPQVPGSSTAPGSVAGSQKSGCLNFGPGARGKRLGPARLGAPRAGNRRRFTGARLRSRARMDRYCVAGGGSLRIGYATPRLSRSLGRSLRRRVRARALILLATSPRWAVRGVAPGMSTRGLAARLSGERRFRIGQNVWYSLPGRQSRIVFKTRAGRVLEVGLANKRLALTRAGEERLLRAWESG
jgi:hypothetical protein